ncbi:restriction endonuclease subunit S [Nodularia sp. UHCC 0506]|uniref:restriction endonuclease subunit S n=1 Tax=Nodularia sp. UHCC 0506 TaxID=3110243 RepID=UPI002B211310|nr:restriction endonuclease subunit S [Nodularia sp. UHCC 0506]MEA5514076.1 restriction endonuclease subunit S [Nodularia sp. UHCC 0506]
MSFQLSPDVDKNKVFIVQCSALNERLDPEYYQPNHYQDLILLKNSPYRNDVLDRVCNRIVDGPFGSSIKASDYVERGIPFIRVADVTRGEGSIKTDDLIFITEEAHERIIRSKVIPNDVVIAKTGATMGAASLVPANIPEANIRGDLAALSLNENDCIPRYVVIYINTNIGQRLFWRLDSGGTRGRVVIGNLKKYPIVIPPKNIQEEVIKKMDNAYALKKQKEEDAQRSLDSIDDYLLGELGINLVEPEENTIQSRIFYRKLSDVSTSRFDASAYRKNLSLLSSTFPMEKFKNCVFINPLTLFHGIKANIEATFIPMECVSDIYGEADISQIKNTEDSNGYTQFLENDLIWAKITPCMQNGKSAVVSNLVNGIGFGSTEFHVFRSKPDIDIRYIHALLRLKILRYFATLYFSGSAGHQRVSDDFFRKLSIPKLPINKQLEIVKHIDEIRNRAKQLRQEAEADLEKAKQEVEAMILGIE